MADEKLVENYAAAEAKRRGILAVKLARLAGPGWPDHTFFKDGQVAFLEYKATETSRFQPLQKYYLELLTKLGFLAEVAWTREQVDDFFEEFEYKIQGY